MTSETVIETSNREVACSNQWWINCKSITKFLECRNSIYVWSQWNDPKGFVRKLTHESCRASNCTHNQLISIRFATNFEEFTDWTIRRHLECWIRREYWIEGCWIKINIERSWRLMRNNEARLASTNPSLSIKILIISRQAIKGYYFVIVNEI